MRKKDYSEDYSAYENIKSRAYAKNVTFYKWATRSLPRSLLGKLFPVIGFLALSRGTSVLDIGAGSGLYAHLLRQRFGCLCNEVEPHLRNLYDAQEHVMRCDIDSIPVDRKYDVILLIDIIEHLHPAAASDLLERLRLVTHADSSIYIKTPNTSSLAGLESSFGDLTHIQHLNAISLPALAINNGYLVRRISGIGPNLNPKRLLMRVVSLPFDLLLLAHLKAQGCSGVLIKPSIIVELKKCS